jgi:hypothetical protein
MKTKIHVLPMVISRNGKLNENKPPIIIKHGNIEGAAHEVEILDQYGKVAARIVYDPTVREGARVWIETENKIKYK